MRFEESSGAMTDQGESQSAVGQAVLRHLAPLLVAGFVLFLGFKLTQPQVSTEHNLFLPVISLSFLGLTYIFHLLLQLVQRPVPDGERQFYDAVVNALAEPAVVADAKGRAVYANAPYMQLAARASLARLVGFDVLYAGYPDFAEPVYQLGQAASQGRPEIRDMRIAAGSSTPFADPLKAKWLRLQVSPMPANNRGGKTLWRLLDITDDRMRQESAFARLQFIISYLDQAPVGFFSALPNGKVDYINATLAAWLGFDLMDVQSGKMTLEQVIGPASAKVLTALEPKAGGYRVDQFALPLRAKNGSSEIYTLINRADYDGSGKALPARCMVMRGAVEERSVEGPLALMSSLPIGYATLDDQGRIINANAPLLSLSSKLVRGGKMASTLDAESAARFMARLSEAKSDETVQLDVGFAGTEQRSAHLTLVPGKPGEGSAVFAIDKTESKLLEAQLVQSQKMQAVGQLSSGLAHDFNNMLTPIIGFADLLLIKMRPTDPSFQDVMSIKNNANRAAGLVRQLLAFSRKQTILPKPCDLPDQMADLGLLLKRVVGDKVELSISHARDLWPVLVDIHQLEQAIVNLASNARDAMPKGGRFSLSTYNLAAADTASLAHPLNAVDYVVVQTTDTGQGIPKELLDKIWDPFFTTKEVGKGTGLGLSMVYGFVKQSGGFIYCDSEMGKGTTFRIFLPRLDAKAAAAMVAAKPVAEAAPLREDFSGRGRILIVEDEDSVRAFAARALTSRGYTVVEASTGQMGLEVLEDDKVGFELILSDVVMPEMDGPTMLKELRKRGITAKFIFMSGYAEDAFEKTPDGPTDFGFIQKPFSLKQLVEKVKAEMG